MERPLVSSGRARRRGDSSVRRVQLGCDAPLRRLAALSSGGEPMSLVESLGSLKSDYDSEISEECHTRQLGRHHNPADGPPPLTANDTSTATDAQQPLQLSHPYSLHHTNSYSRRFPSLSVWRLPNDTLHYPALAAKSLDLQTREIFNTSLSTVLIPATFAAFSGRLDQDIIAFIRDDQRAQCPPIEWTVRCYATWHLATTHADPALHAQSRYIYGVLLRYLRASLDDPRSATSQTTLTVAVLMGIYEVFDAASPDAWLVHIRGAKEILRRRGAAAHFSGFPRTIVFSCRAFFIAEALVSCEECFLAEGEWASVNARAFEREDRRGRGCRVVSLMDRTYREVVRVPGMVARARRVLADGQRRGGSTGLDMSRDGDGGEMQVASREELRGEIQRSQAGLRRLRRALTSLSPEEATPRDQDGQLIIDPAFLPAIMRYNLYAASAVEELLGRLSAMLADTKELDPSCPESTAVQIRTTPRTKSPDIVSPSRASSGSTSLDFLFLSLGVTAL
ncbi:hypothetical protein BJY00DRAFT_317523 [Aspergillus carlsbadensis]|nr:hypothetical protein BJY00DRAFT_317523 [Aspergillus carlsbadensis]